METINTVTLLFCPIWAEIPSSAAAQRQAIAADDQLAVHDRLVAGLSSTSPTTQSCANPVSRGLWKNLRFSVPFARFEPALLVSAAGGGGTTRQK
jgi:hypothetical protein